MAGVGRERRLRERQEILQLAGICGSGGDCHHADSGSDPGFPPVSRFSLADPVGAGPQWAMFGTKGA